jgi:uncharacterized phage-like protein YoqJ
MILSATGHRPDKLLSKDCYSQENLKILIGFAKMQIRELNPEKVISGMALGWDQAVALAAFGLNIPVIAAVPCYNQDSKWGSTYQNLYKQLLEKSSEVIYVHEGEYTKTCMHERNIYMVDNSDEVLALFDGTIGGTMHCYNYAAKQGKPIHNSWNDWVDYKEANKVY